MIDRNTSFGQMTTIERHGHTVEILRFDREGKDHTHDVWEYAVCLEGPCNIIIGSFANTARIGEVYRVAPGTPHRMRPTTDQPSIWVLWYVAEEALPES